MPPVRLRHATRSSRRPAGGGSARPARATPDRLGEVDVGLRVAADPPGDVGSPRSGNRCRPCGTGTRWGAGLADDEAAAGACDAGQLAARACVGGVAQAERDGRRVERGSAKCRCSASPATSLMPSRAARRPTWSRPPREKSQVMYFGAGRGRGPRRWSRRRRRGRTPVLPGARSSARGDAPGADVVLPQGSSTVFVQVEARRDPVEHGSDLGRVLLERRVCHPSSVAGGGADRRPGGGGRAPARRRCQARAWARPPWGGCAAGGADPRAKVHDDFGGTA